MAKTQGKKTTKGIRNDDRKNGKANKKATGSRGSKRTKLDEGMKVLLGGGMLARWEKFNHDEAMIMKAKDRRKPKVDSDN